MASDNQVSTMQEEARPSTNINRNVGTRTIELLVWLGFFLSLGIAFWPQIFEGVSAAEPYVHIDGLTRVMWPYLTGLTGLLLRFSSRYMRGNRRLFQFFLNCFFFLISVMVLSATNHLIFFAVAWFSMGLFMARLISHNVEWPQAQAAGRLARQYFLGGSLYLMVGILVLYTSTETWDLSASLRALDTLSTGRVTLVFLCLFLASVIQSSLFPLQNWMMSSMTAPTPASALMHAGFVNAGGILLMKFAPLFVSHSFFLSLLLIVGAVSAFMGKIWKMVQPAVKRQLGCSTIAQMGFMIMQGGLGYFSAAITHLILHGFYKGYLFLSSGSAVVNHPPHTKKPNDKRTGFAQGALSIVTGLLSGLVFMLVTGKGFKWNSGLFLVFIVVLTVMHGTNEFFSSRSLPAASRVFGFPLTALATTGLYGFIFNGVTYLTADLPAVISPTPFSGLHAGLVILFLAGYLFFRMGWYERFQGLYVLILNASQPHPATIISSKEEYHVG